MDSILTFDTPPSSPRTSVSGAPINHEFEQWLDTTAKQILPQRLLEPGADGSKVDRKFLRAVHYLHTRDSKFSKGNDDALDKYINALKASVSEEAPNNRLALLKLTQLLKHAVEHHYPDAWRQFTELMNGNFQSDVMNCLFFCDKAGADNDSSISLATDPKLVYLQWQQWKAERSAEHEISDDIFTRAVEFGHWVQRIDDGDGEAAHQFVHFMEENKLASVIQYSGFPGRSGWEHNFCHYFSKAFDLLSTCAKKLLSQQAQSSDEKGAVYLVTLSKWDGANHYGMLQKMFREARGICQATKDAAYSYFESNPLHLTPQAKFQLKALDPERFQRLLVKQRTALHAEEFKRHLSSLARKIYAQPQNLDALQQLTDLLVDYPEAQKALADGMCGPSPSIHEKYHNQYLRFYLGMAVNKMDHAGARFTLASLDLQSCYKRHFPKEVIQTPVTPRNLGSQLIKLPEAKVDIRRFLSEFEMATQKGCFAAMEALVPHRQRYALLVGADYLHGNPHNGVEQDLDEAVFCLECAMKNSSKTERSAAAYLLFVAYKKKADPKNAWRYCEMAAESGHLHAQLELEYRLFNALHMPMSNPNSEIKKSIAETALKLSDLLREDNPLLHVRPDVKRADAFLEIAEKNGDKAVFQQIAEKKKEAHEFAQGENRAPTQRPIKTQNQAVPMSQDEVMEMHYIEGKSYLQGRIPPEYVPAILSFAEAVKLGHKKAGDELGELLLNERLLTEIAKQINRKNFQTLLPVIQETLGNHRKKLVELLKKVDIPEALAEMEKILVSGYQDKSSHLPPEFHSDLKWLADKGYFKAAGSYSEILKAKEAKASVFDKAFTFLFSEDSEHYERIAKSKEPKAEESIDQKKIIEGRGGSLAKKSAKDAVDAAKKRKEEYEDQDL